MYPDRFAEALHARLCHRLGTDPARTRPWMQALLGVASHYAWPGNVRELENLLERLLAYAGDEPGEAPRVQSLPQRLRLIVPELFDEGPAPPSWQQARTMSEAEHIQQVLASCGGDRQMAAQQLGISRTTLWRKLRQAGVTTGM